MKAEYTKQGELSLPQDRNRSMFSLEIGEPLEFIHQSLYIYTRGDICHLIRGIIPTVKDPFSPSVIHPEFITIKLIIRMKDGLKSIINLITIRTEGIGHIYWNGAGFDSKP